MTPRQRVLAALRRTTLPDRCPFEISWGAFTPGLMKVYRERTGSALEPCEHFGFDTRSVDLEPTRKQTDFRRFYPDPIPDNVVFDEWGVGMVPGPLEHFVEFKQHHDASMPQFIKFPVQSEAEFERFAAERLTLNAAQRLSPEWQAMVASGRVQASVGRGDLHEDEQFAAAHKPAREEWPRKCWADRWGGFFGSLRNLMGVQNLCMGFYDQPRLIERMMEERAERIIEITAEVLKHTRFDVFWFWEDMAYNGGPLVGSDLFRKFAFPHYVRVCDWLRGQGIEHIGLDSDGRITSLIPLWLDAGIDHLWPFEVQSGMDVVAVRKQYGSRLSIMGGIDKRVLSKGGAVMRAEVDRVMPLVEQGGYLPEIDHSVPPDVSWRNFCDYIGYLKHRLGRG